MRTKEHQVVALPTDKASRLHIQKATKEILLYENEHKEDAYTKPHHLYFLSDEDIKEGDWFIDTSVLDHNYNATLSQALPSSDLTFLNHPTKRIHIRKVVATTNPDLWWQTTSKSIKCRRGIPKIGKEFIEAYVREQGIDKVLLEMEESTEYIPRNPEGDKIPNGSWRLQPKLKPDGSVTVHPVKERMYTREDLSMAWFNALAGKQSFEEWFNKNYPV